MRFLAVLTRRLRAGKTYDDFRRAWYHTVGFGGEAKLYSAINVFDPREIIVVAMGEIRPEQDPMAVARIDVKERLDHPLEAVIEPEIGRTFGILVAEDDFSGAGAIGYQPARVNNEPTDFAEVAQALALAQKVIAQAEGERDRAKKNRDSL